MRKLMALAILILLLGFVSAGYFDYDLISVGCGTEVCDGIDNDCDGAIDEAIERSCQTGSGASICVGVQRCNYGIWAYCDVSAAQVIPETCNNLDDDCDTQIDELWPNKGGMCGLCGNLSCNTGGSGLICSGEGVCGPGAKETQQCGSSNIGECRLGVRERTCSSVCGWGVWSACSGNVEAVTEVCDGLDNDCDGDIDEGCGCTPPGSTKSCGSNVGTCSKGIQICSGGNWDSCSGGVGSSTEICDGLDNDCDGVVDEGCGCTPPNSTKSCGLDTGVCTKGTQTCESGNWGACVGGVTASTELCDNIDNDCDGEIDEGCDCTTGAMKVCGISTGECSTGTQTCVGGQWAECVGSLGPADEICDRKDNDCDGTSDEELTKVCGSSVEGQCVFGNQVCSNGNWSLCTGNVEPVTEACDGALDEDCDGVVDNGCVCAEGQEAACGKDAGACVSGKQICSNNAWGACVGGIGPVTEICGNGIDDDCDGVPDGGCIVETGVSESLLPGQEIDIEDGPFEAPESFLGGGNAFSEDIVDDIIGGVEAVSIDQLIITLTEFDGETTDFDALVTSRVESLVLEKTGFGKIEFRQQITFTENIDIDEVVEILENKIIIDSSSAPVLNAPATLTLIGLAFDDPMVMRNGSPCPGSICEIVSYSGGTLIFKVSRFSEYSAAESENVCPGGEIISDCVCRGVFYSSGYCCGDEHQEYDCLLDAPPGGDAGTFPPINDPAPDKSSGIPMIDACGEEHERMCVEIDGIEGRCRNKRFIEGCVGVFVNRDSDSLEGGEFILGLIIVGLIIVIIIVGGIVVYAHAHVSDKKKPLNEVERIEDYAHEVRDKPKPKKLSEARQKALEEEVIKRLKADKEFRAAIKQQKKEEVKSPLPVLPVKEDKPVAPKPIKETKEDILARLRKNMAAEKKKEEVAKKNQEKEVKKIVKTTEKSVEKQAVGVKEATKQIARSFSGIFGMTELKLESPEEIKKKDIEIGKRKRKKVQ